MEMKISDLYEKCAEFHGHKCPGLSIGVRAAYEAAHMLDLKFSEDEEVVCISENDACGVDGIQVALGCSAGKGNLLFRLRGKQAFSFYNRNTGKSIRLMKRDTLPEMSREEKQHYILEAPFDEIFKVTQVKFELPEVARLFPSVVCESCGELTGEPYIRLSMGKKVCLDCYEV